LVARRAWKVVAKVSVEKIETCVEDCFKDCFEGCLEDCFDYCFEDGFEGCFKVIVKIFESVARAQSSREARPVKIRGAGPWLDLGLGLEGLLWRLVKECLEWL
jgi:hypothetical protein